MANVQKGVPIRNRRANGRYEFGALAEVGDSLVLPITTKAEAARMDNARRVYERRTGRKLTWDFEREADASTFHEAVIVGVRVWRTA
jgi:hypothetical protein